MVPLGTLIDMRDIGGPIFVNRYNLLHGRLDQRKPSPRRQHRRGRSPPSTSSANESLPRSMKTEWTELMFMQIQAGNTAM